jgi:hypothetical protein
MSTYRSINRSLLYLLAPIKMENVVVETGFLVRLSSRPLRTSDQVNGGARRLLSFVMDTAAAADIARLINRPVGRVLFSRFRHLATAHTQTELAQMIGATQSTSQVMHELLLLAPSSLEQTSSSFNSFASEYC